jgi:hypothetical protein
MGEIGYRDYKSEWWDGGFEWEMLYVLWDKMKYMTRTSGVSVLKYITSQAGDSTSEQYLLFQNSRFNFLKIQLIISMAQVSSQYEFEYVVIHVHYCEMFYSTL